MLWGNTLLYLWSVKLIEFIPVVGLKTKVSRFVQSKAQTVHRRDLWLIKTIKKSLLAPQNGGETAGIDMQRRICHPMCFLLSSVVSICWLSIVLLHFVQVEGAKPSIAMNVSVCPSARISRKPWIQTSLNIPCTLLPAAVGWTSPGGVAIRYVHFRFCGRRRSCATRKLVTGWGDAKRTYKF